MTSNVYSLVSPSGSNEGLIHFMRPIFLVNPPKRWLTAYGEQWRQQLVKLDPTKRGILYSFRFGPNGRTWLVANTNEGVLYLVNHSPATNITCEVVHQADYLGALKGYHQQEVSSRTVTQRQFPIL